MEEVIRIVGEEPSFDSLIIDADVHNMYQVANIMDAHDVLADYWKVMARAGRRVVQKEKKPVLVTIPDVAYPEQRKIAWDTFVDQHLPVFRNINETVCALASVCDYYETRNRRKN